MRAIPSILIEITLSANRLTKLFIPCMILFFSSCTSSHPHSPQPGSYPLSTLKVEEVSQLILSSHQPLLNENWLIELKKEKGTWVMSSRVGIPTLLDFYANDHYINHLLDSLTSTKLEELAPHGPLGAFHLDPPRYAIKAITPKASYQLYIGDPASSPESGAYALLRDQTPWVISSPALPILNSMLTWRNLRKPNITFETPDDIDEVKIIRHQKPHFYAQRDGDTWTNQAHQPVRAPIEELLRKILNTQPLNLIEDPEKILKIKNFAKTHPEHVQEIQFSGSLIADFKFILISTADGKTFCHYSNRPDIYFQLKSDLLKALP